MGNVFRQTNDALENMIPQVDLIRERLDVVDEVVSGQLYRSVQVFLPSISFVDDGG